MASVIFTCTLRGESLAFDPFVVRRILLTSTHGRVWGLIRDTHRFRQEIEDVEKSSELTEEAKQARINIASTNLAIAEGVLAKAAFDAFELPPFNKDTKEGITEGEILNVLAEYMDYAEGKD